MAADYFVNGAWYSWGELHSLGYTKSKPTKLLFYNSLLRQVQVVQSKDQDSDYNKLYDDVNHVWVEDIDELGLYRRIDDLVEVYSGESFALHRGYSNSMNSDTVTGVEIDGELLSVEDLHSLGKTLYPCKLYSVSNGTVSAWYDSTLGLYWNVEESAWSTTPPESEVLVKPPNDVFIRTHQDSLILHPQWSLSHSPIRYRSYSFDSQDRLFDSPAVLATGFSLQSSKMLLSEQLYLDRLNKDIRIYVVPDEGADSYDGIHHGKGDIFTGDYKKVWVDSDEDVDFYLGSEHFVYGKTHDDLIDEIYWCDNAEYKTYDTLHLEGYTRARPQLVEIFDSDGEFPEDALFATIVTEVNLRDIPGTGTTAAPGSIVLVALPKNAVVRIEDQSGNFYKTTYNGFTGWFIGTSTYASFYHSIVIPEFQKYETWWFSISEGGYYYRDVWYPDESRLESAGYYVVSDINLYLGPKTVSTKYQSNTYFINDDYYQYSDLHADGYSKYASDIYMYADTSAMTVKLGYCNSNDGYYANGLWYQTVRDLHAAGYNLLDEVVDLFVEPLPTSQTLSGYLGDSSSTSINVDFVRSLHEDDMAATDILDVSSATLLGGYMKRNEPNIVVYEDYKWPVYTDQVHDMQYACGTLRESTIKLYDTHYIEQLHTRLMSIDD